MRNGAGRVLAAGVSAILLAGLAMGEERATIQRAQEALAAQGYDPGPADGVWGRRTREAILKFQAARGLAQSGILDEPTKTALLEPPIEGILVKWDALRGCGFIRERKLANRLRLLPGTTTPIEGESMTLADGLVRGGPWDALGIGTYFEVPADAWREMCGLAFKGAQVTITEQGFLFSKQTEFREGPVR